MIWVFLVVGLCAVVGLIWGILGLVCGVGVGMFIAAILEAIFDSWETTKIEVSKPLVPLVPREDDMRKDLIHN